MRVAGLMSGTSLDGIDVAVIDIPERSSDFAFRLLATWAEPYSEEVRKAILGVSDCTAHVGDIARLHTYLGMLYADALDRCLVHARIPPNTLDLIGCHGQTIFHQGQDKPYLGKAVRCTLQIGDSSSLAERFGKPVVTDFRPRDMAAGGTGAPLVPYLDYLAFRSAHVSRIALNIGGIANLSAIRAGDGPDGVIAFDTGPGNMVMDNLVRQATGGVETFDRGGARARQGTPSEAFVSQELSQGYYAQQPPKSAGREEYGEAFLHRLREAVPVLEDQLATATLLTARSIALGVLRFVRPAMDPTEMLVAGGGRHNYYLMELLTRELPGIRIESTDSYQLPVDFKEAIAFALLAHATWRGKPSNVPTATGARHAVVLGKITP